LSPKTNAVRRDPTATPPGNQWIVGTVNNGDIVIFDDLRVIEFTPDTSGDTGTIAGVCSKSR
jgi:hypothetical protein